jgi:hypothetical protein
MISPSLAAIVAPSSSTSRTCTPSSGGPTDPGRRSPAARTEQLMSASVISWRSTIRCPVVRASRS